MDGILLVDKPANLSSHKVLQMIKHQFGITKIGHAGTLDPMATGVLVVLLGSATKLSDYLLSANKEYDTTLRLFTKTDTGDITGTVVENESPRKIPLAAVEAMVQVFDKRTYDQTPPIYSAIKYQGKKLYEYARQNQTVELQPRIVTIYQAQLKKYDEHSFEISLHICCSKGTYIRSLVEDMAKMLGSIGTMSALRRTNSGAFTISQAHSLDVILAASDLTNLVMPMSTALALNHHQLRQVQDLTPVYYGQKICFPEETADTIFIINQQAELVAIYERECENLFRCSRGLWTAEMHRKYFGG